MTTDKTKNKTQVNFPAVCRLFNAFYASYIVMTGKRGTDKPKELNCVNVN